MEKNTGTPEIQPNLTNWLTDDQLAAITGKIKPEDAVRLQKESGVQDLVLAYYVAKARKEANDAIFSAKRNFFVHELIKHQMMLVSDKPGTVDQGSNGIAAVAIECDPKQRYTLASLMKDRNLSGKTAMESETLKAFEIMCELLEVNPKNIK